MGQPKVLSFKYLFFEFNPLNIIKKS
jgi:hypothetical protein